MLTREQHRHKIICHGLGAEFRITQRSFKIKSTFPNTNKMMFPSIPHHETGILSGRPAN